MISLGPNSTVFYADCQIQEVYPGGGLFEFPGKYPEVICLFLEALPAQSCTVAQPDAYHIIYVALEQEEVVAVVWQQVGAFVDPEINGGLHAGT